MIRWHAIRNHDGTRDKYAIAGNVAGMDRYTIARIGTGERTRYELWDRKHMASSHGTADEARAHAETLIADDKGMTRRTDPDTSRQAAQRTVVSGQRDDHITRIVAAIHAKPGSTSAELAQITGLERHEAARRTSDAERAALVRKGPARKCSASGRSAVTWHPALTESQRQCLDGAA